MDQQAAGAGGRIPRKAERTSLPHDSPARLVLPSRETVFVTLDNISRAGCCLMRRGDIPIEPGERVTVEIWRDNIATKESLAAEVRWVRAYDGCTRAGLRFLDTSGRTHRAVQTYLLRSGITAA